LVHESLHALSDRFNAEARRAHATNFIEGVTQLLTLRILANQLKLQPKGYRYIGFRAVAQSVADKIGEAALEKAYFHDGYRSVEAAVDLVSPGAFRSAMFDVDHLRVADALVDLGHARTKQVLVWQTMQACEVGMAQACQVLRKWSEKSAD
jgi:hypothetical protein